MQFEWDEDKNRVNIEKHGISFDLAKRVFDGFTVNRVDDRRDYGETREVSVGKIDNAVVVAVVHTDREGICRIISARRANKLERDYYDQEVQKALNS